MNVIGKTGPRDGKRSDAPRPSVDLLGEGIMDNTVGGYSGFMTRGTLVRVGQYTFTYMGKGEKGDALMSIRRGEEIVAQEQSCPWVKKTTLEADGRTISITPAYIRSTCAVVEIEVETHSLSGGQ